MDLDLFKELKERIGKELIITKENVLQKSLECVKLQSKYVDIFTREGKILKNKIANLDKLYGELYHNFKFGDFKFALDKKTEIDIYVKKDESYHSMVKEINDQKMIVEYLEKTIYNINQMSFHIKNFIDYNNFLAGN